MSVSPSRRRRFWPPGWVGWFLRERVDKITIVSCTLAMVGVAIMVWEGFAVGSWFGNIAALVGAGMMASYVVALRQGGGVDMMPAVALSGYIAAIVALPLMDGFAISLHDFLLAALQGIVISALCNTAFAYCARHIPAAELTLLSLLGKRALAILGLAGYLPKRPYGATIVGGAVVLVAVGFQALWPVRHHFLGKRKPTGI